MAADLEREVLGYLVDLFDRKVMDARGRVRKDLYTRQAGPRGMPNLGGLIGPAAGYLALNALDGNPYHGSDAVLALALYAGERLVIDHADVNGYTKPNHFTIWPLATLYEMLAEHAGKARLAKWRDTLARNLAATDALIDRTWPSLGRPGPHSGTGPNHFFGWFAVGYHQARVLGENALARKIERAMLRQIRLQSPGGYFPEHIGPATLYHHVSLGGLAEYHRLNPKPVTRRAVERGVAFMVRAIYPDLRGIETFDERNRLGAGRSFQHALAWTPEGRNLLARVVAGQRQRICADSGHAPLRDYEWWTVGHAFRCLAHLVATRGIRTAASLPIDRERFTWRLEDSGLVRKARPWFYALSAWSHGVEPGNPYHLERTQAISVYHNAAGLIVGGGNDKRAYHAATIHILEGGEVHYFPPESGRLRVSTKPRVLPRGGPCDRVEFDYGAAQVALEVRVESPKRLRIGLAVQLQMTQPEIALVLQLPLRLPITLRNGPSKLKLSPAREGQPGEVHPLSRSLTLPTGCRFSLPPGATLLWPHIPWSPYRPPAYRDIPDAAVGLLRLPLTAPDWQTEVVLTVAGKGH